MQVGAQDLALRRRHGRARRCSEYEFDAPEEATLLDCLDIVKDRHDGTLAYRKSCRMMICGSCGMRMDGAAVLACKTRMYDIAQAGHVPVISAMGNLPIDQGPRRRHGAVLGEVQGDEAVPPAGLRPSRRTARSTVISQERMNVIHKESLCINCGCCVSECNAMESDPEFLGPQALAKGMRFVGDPRDARQGRAARASTAASTGSGSARAATSATSAARRASTRATRSRSSAPRR